MNNLILKFILLCHFLTVCFVVLVPFLNNYYLILLHTIVVPFIMFHWYLNDNTCVLTEIERKLRLDIDGQIPDDNNCFTCQLINPIYDFKKNNMDYSTIIYTVTIILWLISVFHLYKGYKSGDFVSLYDLLIVRWSDIMKSNGTKKCQSFKLF